VNNVLSDPHLIADIIENSGPIQIHENNPSEGHFVEDELTLNMTKKIYPDKSKVNNVLSDLHSISNIIENSVPIEIHGNNPSEGLFVDDKLTLDMTGDQLRVQDKKSEIMIPSSIELIGYSKAK